MLGVPPSCPALSTRTRTSSGSAIAATSTRERAVGATYEEIAAAGGGIRATVRATAAGSVDELAAAGRDRARRMLADGTTTVEVKSGYGLEHDAEMRQLDAADLLREWEDLPDVVATYLPLHAVPDGPRDAYIDDVCTRGVAGAAKRARFVDAFCEAGAYTVAECERLFSAAAPKGCAPRSTPSSARTPAARCSPRRRAR